MSNPVVMGDTWNTVPMWNLVVMVIPNFSILPAR